MNFHWMTGIEDTFIPHTDAGRRKLDLYELQNHYTEWKQDLELMRWLGVDMVRYGIPWYKVEPQEGRFDWAWTDKVIHTLAEFGIKPVVDLVHYGTPTWLPNQFLNNRYSERVSFYASQFAHRYRDVVEWYTPLNEPHVNAMFCGANRYWPPYLEGDHGFVTIWRSLVRGMVMTEKAVRAAQPGAKFMQVDASSYTLTADPACQERADFLNERLFLTYDALLGRLNDRHPLAGYLYEHGMTDADFAFHQENLGTFDYMGVNFYPELSVHALSRQADGAFKTVNVRSPELYETVLRRYWDRYHIPIIHTESSTSGTVEARLEWMHHSLETVARLRRAGLPIDGYTWWPLYDLIDWEYRHGITGVEKFVAPMGLWSMEMRFDGVFDRVRTAAADEFKAMIATFDIGELPSPVIGSAPLPQLPR